MIETMQDKTRQLAELLQTAVERHIGFNIVIGHEIEKERYMAISSRTMYDFCDVEITIREMSVRQPHCNRVHLTDGCLPLLMLVDDRDQSAVIMRLPELAEEGE